MKNLKLIGALAGLILFGAQSVSAQDATGDIEATSYAIGYQIGLDFIERDLNVNVDTVVRAIRDAHGKRDPEVPQERMAEILEEMQRKIQEEELQKFRELAEANEQRSAEFLAENRAKKGIVELPSGVQYREIEEGQGRRPTMEDTVTVHYRGSLMNGFEFDSSFARGVPATFPVNGVLKGWQEVLPLMKEGAKWQIFVPAEFAYGVRGKRPIGPNEALVFDIHLIEVKQEAG